MFLYIFSLRNVIADKYLGESKRDNLGSSLVSVILDIDPRR